MVNGKMIRNLEKVNLNYKVQVQCTIAMVKSMKVNGLIIAKTEEVNTYSIIGIFYFRDGSKYEGNWLDDKKNGKGELLYSNGNRYEGQWKDDVIIRRGII